MMHGFDPDHVAGAVNTEKASALPTTAVATATATAIASAVSRALVRSD